MFRITMIPIFHQTIIQQLVIHLLQLCTLPLIYRHHLPTSLHHTIHITLQMEHITTILLMSIIMKVMAHTAYVEGTTNIPRSIMGSIIILHVHQDVALITAIRILFAWIL